MGARPLQFPVYLSVDLDFPCARDVVLKARGPAGETIGSVCMEEIRPFRCPHRVWTVADLVPGPDCSPSLGVP